MKTSNTLILIAAVAAFVMALPTSAIVCPPTICDIVRCDNSITAANCQGVFREKGGFCGCCPACVTIIPAGGRCLQIKGVPSTTECIEGTTCRDGICQYQS